MKKTALALILISALLFSAVAGAMLVNLVKADPYTPEMVPMEHAYIRSNGDIDPPTLPIQRADNVYVLKGNILNYTIEIQKDNVMIDGNGFSLTIPSFGEEDENLMPKSGFPVFQISSKNNVIIKNMAFHNYFTSISVRNSSNIVIIQNNMTKGSVSIYMSSCANCSIMGNRLIDNSNTGFIIRNSTFLSIAYNTISRNYFHEGQIDTLSNSNISRNDITENFLQGSPGLGLYLTGHNFNNRIFENNFIDNSIGLLYQGSRGMSANNKAYNNYWSNYQSAIVNNAADAASGVDSSPLTSPISTSFDPSLFPLPSLTPADTPTTIAQSDSEPFPTALAVGALGISAAFLVTGLTIYFKKHKPLRERQRQEG